MTVALFEEIKRLRPLNPHVRMYEKGWLKLVATARVNVCRKLGVDDTQAMDILRTHQTGYNADIVINS